MVCFIDCTNNSGGDGDMKFENRIERAMRDGFIIGFMVGAAFVGLILVMF